MGDYLIHHGIKGQKWGIRRYQNEDGTLTNAGEKRYSSNTSDKKLDRYKEREMQKIDKYEKWAVDRFEKREAKLNKKIEKADNKGNSGKTEHLKERLASMRKEESTRRSNTALEKLSVDKMSRSEMIKEKRQKGIVSVANALVILGGNYSTSTAIFVPAVDSRAMIRRRRIVKGKIDSGISKKEAIAAARNDSFLRVKNRGMHFKY